MKYLFLTLGFAICTLLIAKAEQTEEKAIESAIRSFVKAGDQNDAAKISLFLDDKYRIVMNQLFGSKDVSVLPRQAYLEKIKSREWGGDNRTVEIISITMNGNSAAVKAILKGEKMNVSSLFSLIKDTNGNWKLIEDIPVIN